MLTFLVFRHINFTNATPDELEQLAQSCEAFGGASGKAGKMDSECFSLSLDPFRTDLIKIIRGFFLEGEESLKNMEIEAYKLNIYGAHLSFICTYMILYCCPGKGSSFKPRVDPPRGKNMFGSLVIVFPTFHEGGALSLRHRGHEWIFDFGQVLAGGGSDGPSIGYVAFLNDMEQNVAPVTSGHCVTLTYNLYFDDAGGPVSGKDPVSETVSNILNPPKPPNQDRFRETFEALLENPEFMAEGGTLAFGLRHGYPDDDYLESVCDILKGSDMVVYQSARALGFEPTLYMFYGNEHGFNGHESMMVDRIIWLNSVLNINEEKAMYEVIQEGGGIFVRQDDGSIYDPDDYVHDPEPIEWVTPTTNYNRSAVRFLGGEVIEGACMIVRIGKAGDRLAYPRVAQIKNAYEQSGFMYRKLYL